MNEKDLKRLSRLQLLEIMLEQSRELDRITEELNEVQAKLAEKEQKVAGTDNVAEACIAINRAAESAEAAAGQYLENIRRICGEKAAAAGKTAEWDAALEAIEGTDDAAEQMDLELTDLEETDDD